MAAQDEPQKQFPWCRTPLIANAPMSGFARFKLAVAVTRAGGLGQIGFLDNGPIMDAQLTRARKLLEDIETSSVDGILPVGVGVIVFGADLRAWSRLVAKHKPAMVWLFAAHNMSEYGLWTEEIRRVSPCTRVWVQLGSVSLGLQVAKLCRPDGLVMQGSDAGGHGHERGASVVSLVPEMCDALESAGLADSTYVIAAGGIADGRAVLAALVLGAQGVVMGTAFLAAPETHIDQEDRALVLAAKDGGQATVRTRVFDLVWGADSWPEIFDGRGLVNQSYLDKKDGMSEREICQRFQTGMCSRDSRWNVIWAGSGVGMVGKEQSAAQILDRIRAEIQTSITRSKSIVVQA